MTLCGPGPPLPEPGHPGFLYYFFPFLFPLLFFSFLYFSFYISLHVFFYSLYCLVHRKIPFVQPCIGHPDIHRSLRCILQCFISINPGRGHCLYLGDSLCTSLSLPPLPTPCRRSVRTRTSVACTRRGAQQTCFVALFVNNNYPPMCRAPRRFPTLPNTPPHPLPFLSSPPNRNPQPCRTRTQPQFDPSLTPTHTLTTKEFQQKKTNKRHKNAIDQRPTFACRDKLRKANNPPPFPHPRLVLWAHRLLAVSFRSRRNKRPCSHSLLFLSLSPSPSPAHSPTQNKIKYPTPVSIRRCQTPHAPSHPLFVAFPHFPHKSTGAGFFRVALGMQLSQHANAKSPMILPVQISFPCYR